MISREQFIESLLKECEICKHLYTKIPVDQFEFRPSESQRSKIELLRYLAVCGSASMHVMLHESDWKLWKPYTDSVSNMTPEEFPAAMDRQAEEMKKMMNSIAEEDFLTKEVKHPTGATMPLGVGLMRMSYSWLVAYRMQLFLYLKQVGVPDLHTSNVWNGVDRKPPVTK